MSDGPEWFAPKRYGYGAGLPTSWQGWTLLTGYILLLAGRVRRRRCAHDERWVALALGRQ